MANYSERIAKIYPSRFGGSFGLDGQQGLYFNTKGSLPAFVREGVTVEFEGQMGRNNKSVFVTDASLKEVAGAAPAPGPSNVSTDEAIRYQSSRKDAIEIVKLLLANGALVLPEKAAKRAGIIEASVDRFTAIYFEDIETLGALGRTPPDAPAEKPAKAAKARPAADDEDDDGDEVPE